MSTPRRAAPHWRDGAQWEEAGIRYTVNSSKELAHDLGAYYLNMVNLKTGAKATAVYNSDGTLAQVKANKDWVEVPTQKQSIDWVALLRDSFRRALRFWGGRR